MKRLQLQTLGIYDRSNDKVLPQSDFNLTAVEVQCDHNCDIISI